MSNIDRKYIDALNTFTSALEQIVETLKEQQSTGKSDVVNEFLKSMPDNLVTVVEDLKKTTEKGFADIKSDNEKILAKIESIKKAREAGTFDRIEDPKNKNKIVDGIKVVILIAAGVLALGMAFKLIGKVNIASVLILGTAMLAMAVTYSKISSISGLKFGQVIKIAALMPLMAAGLAISGLLLRNFPRFTLAQGLSILFIGGALGAVSVLMLEALNKMKLRSLLLVPLLPFILPFVALGIVKASAILGGIIPLSFRQVVAVVLVGAAMGVAMFAVGLALRFMKNVTWKELVMLPLMMPLIAWSIVKASEIFQDMRSLRDPFGVLKTTAVVGLSLLIFSPALFILGKMRFKDALSGSVIVPILAFSIVMASRIFVDFVPLRQPPFTVLLSSLAMGLSLLIFAPAVFIIGKMKMSDILAGAAAIPIMALAIVIAAGIFAGLPNRMIYPDFMWSLGVGLSMLIFAPVVYATSKIGLKKMAEAMLVVPLLASLIVATAIIFKLLPNRMEYPSIEWTLGAGLSILAFGVMSVALGAIMASTAGIGFAAIAAGMAAIALIAVTIVATAAILSKGNYGIYPSLQWTLGVGGSLLAFSLISVAAAAAGLVSLIGSFFTGGKNPMVKLAESMIQVAEKLNEFDWATAKHPSKEYTQSIGDFLLTFAKIYTLVSATEGFNKIVGAIFGGGKTDPFTVFIMKAADSMIYLHKRLNEVNWNTKNYPSKDYTDGVGGFLESMANVFWRISKVEGFNRIITRLFGGGADTFTVFIVKAADSMLYLHGQLSKANWGTENYPRKQYAEGVGGLLESLAFVFSKISKVEGFNRIITSLFGGGADNFTVFIQKAAFSMKYLNEQLGSVNWTGNYPKREFAEGVGGLLESLANSFAAVSKVDRRNGILSIFTKQKTTFDEFIRSAADSMIILNQKLGGTNWDAAKYPGKEYSEGVGTFLVMMAEAYSKINRPGFFGAIASIFGGGNKQTLSQFVEESSNSIVKASNILAGANFNVNIKKEWIEGFSIFMITTSDMLDKVNFKGRDKKDLENIGLILLKMTEYSRKISEINFGLDIKKSWIDNFTNFMISISDMTDRIRFKKSDLKDLEKISMMLGTDTSSKWKINIIEWSIALSKGNFNTEIKRKWVDDFSYFILSIADMVDDFKIKKSDEQLVRLNRILSDAAGWSKIISDGKFDVIIKKAWVDNFSIFMSSITDMINDTKINQAKAISFAVYSDKVIEIIVKWSKITSGNTFEGSLNKKWVENFSYFMISISDVISKSEFDQTKIMNFVNSSLVIPTISGWSKGLSSISDLSIDKNKIENFSYFILKIASTVKQVEFDRVKIDNFKIYSEKVVLVIESWSKSISETSKLPLLQEEKTKSLTNFIVFISDTINKSKFDNTKANNFKNAIDNITSAIVKSSSNISSLQPIKKEWVDNFSYFMITSVSIVDKSSIDDKKLNKFESSSKRIILIVKDWTRAVSENKFDSAKTEWIRSLSAFMIAVSEIVSNTKFETLRLDEFILSLNKILGDSQSGLSAWSKVIAQGDYSKYPAKEYVDSFYYYLIKIDKLTSGWSTTIEESEIFNMSVKLIFDAFSKLPNLNDGIVKSMTIIKNALKELSEGMDIFMHEKRGGLFGGIATLAVGKKERSMEDFKLFAEGLSLIVSSMSLLSTIKPVPGGVTQAFIEFVKQLKSLPELPGLNEKAEVINKLSTSFATLADSIGKVNSNLQSFVSLYKGIPSISTPETTNALQTVDGASKLNVVNAGAGQNILDKTKEKPIEVKVTSEEPKIVEKTDDKQQKFYSDISDIKSLLYEIRENLNSPPKAGSFN